MLHQFQAILVMADSMFQSSIKTSLIVTLGFARPYFIDAPKAISSCLFPVLEKGLYYVNLKVRLKILQVSHPFMFSNILCIAPVFSVSSCVFPCSSKFEGWHPGNVCNTWKQMENAILSTLILFYSHFQIPS